MTLKFPAVLGQDINHFLKVIFVFNLIKEIKRKFQMAAG